MAIWINKKLFIMYHFLDNELHYDGKNYTAIYIVTNPAILWYAV